jgi:hypothetical protein
MDKQSVEFVRYDASVPADIEVWCACGFHENVASIFHAHKPMSVVQIANFNALVKRFATGARLSSDAFAPEPPGYAFRCGPFRFYGVFGSQSSAHFVLSHVIYKKQQKLAPADKKRMNKASRDFDTFLLDTKRVQS